MLLAASYPFLDVLWTMFIFFLWIIWFWLLFTVFVDVFRRHDIGGGRKALWLIFVIILPFLGVFIYIITENDGMTQRNHRAGPGTAGSTRRLRARDRGRRRGCRDRQRQDLARPGHDHAGRVRRDQAEGAGLSRGVC